MVEISGINVKAKVIPKRQLVLAWKELTRKPFPRVKAYRLTDEDFDRVIRLRRCEEDMEREREEWGRVLSTMGTDACVFNAEAPSKAESIIIVRGSPYHSLDEILKHELTHIVRGDL
jgi:hypothetical protein